MKSFFQKESRFALGFIISAVIGAGCALTFGRWAAPAVGISSLSFVFLMFIPRQPFFHSIKGVAGLILGAVFALALVTEIQTPSEPRLLQPSYTERMDIKPTRDLMETRALVAAEQVVKGRLKDPGSAKFEGMYFLSSGGSQVVCGRVNSKNSYGGYDGFQRFVAGSEGLVFFEPEVADFENVWNRLCIKK